ncbi:MAG: hypothetical protein C4520_09090 [Candidatus Abyssobacteria bacterium SURF_5]|uniref:PilZ domain-containing protein n=1 Tax=Abyssobacteria bacterium (strain SURF_5) TaxID=2093360 RepID=A0A3A4NRZ0_ABYX5|nr:MAG: hypothetical protein C4520_09090 [Candidatus Abyssubacteria bacterium SURF_5]
MNTPVANDTTAQERRRASRISCSRFACSCSLKPESPSEVIGDQEKLGALLLNLCAGGVCLESNFKPRPGSMMQFQIRPIEGPEMRATIKILHARPSRAKGFYKIGSEFEDLSEEDRQNLLTLLHMVERIEKDLAQK